MRTCIICRFETELDDQVITGQHACICLRCYDRETGNITLMPKALRREIVSALAETEAA